MAKARVEEESNVVVDEPQCSKSAHDQREDQVTGRVVRQRGARDSDTSDITTSELREHTVPTTNKKTVAQSAGQGVSRAKNKVTKQPEEPTVTIPASAPVPSVPAPLSSVASECPDACNPAAAPVPGVAAQLSSVVSDCPDACVEVAASSTGAQGEMDKEVSRSSESAVHLASTTEKIHWRESATHRLFKGLILLKAQRLGTNIGNASRRAAMAILTKPIPTHTPSGRSGSMSGVPQWL